jgi:hypothetical protein
MAFKQDEFVSDAQHCRRLRMILSVDRKDRSFEVHLDDEDLAIE